MTYRDSDTLHVLLVEDSLDQANLVRRWLESSGSYQVTNVQDGVRGSTLAREREWSLIITDINLPGSDGIEVVRASKSTHANTPVLVMTAYKDQSYSARALKEGADGFLHKPLEHADLMQRVEELIAAGGTVEETSRGPTVLAIGAHPDDVEAGCGGILLRHLDQGHPVVTLVLSRSEHDQEDEDRLGEAELAARLMGCRAVFADLPPGSLDGAVAAISRVIEAFEPDVLYCHSEHDHHEHHVTTYRAALAAAMHVPAVYCYQSRTSTVEFRPSRFVEVSEYIARKKEILALFQTSGRSRPYLTPAFVEASAIYWSRFAGFRRVEPLEVIRAPAPKKERASAVANHPAHAFQVAP